MKKSRKRFVVYAAVISFLFIIGIVVVVLIIGTADSRAFKKYFEAFEKGDRSTMINLTVPKDIQKEFYDDKYNCGVRDYIKAYKKSDELLFSELKKKGKVTFSYSIKRRENLNKLDKLEEEFDKLNIEDLDDFIDIMEESAYCREYDLNSSKISKAYAIKYKWRIELDGKKLQDGSNVLIAFKYKNKWYLTSSIDYEAVIYSLNSEEYEKLIKMYESERQKAYKALL